MSARGEEGVGLRRLTCECARAPAATVQSSDQSKTKQLWQINGCESRRRIYIERRVRRRRRRGLYNKVGLVGGELDLHVLMIFERIDG